uniref:Uncharacterized protein n=1 Tax=Timema bartmani TaxID=61472 RepID=A0A7R9I1R9_9NEOP|nr:unnamed protein product [Timema bartmani]
MSVAWVEDNGSSGRHLGRTMVAGEDILGRKSKVEIVFFVLLACVALVNMVDTRCVSKRSFLLGKEIAQEYCEVPNRGASSSKERNSAADPPEHVQGPAGLGSREF